MNAATKQRVDALERANRIRLSRSQERTRISRMPRDRALVEIARIVADPPEHWATARLGYLLQTPKHCGPKYAGQILAVDPYLHADIQLGHMTRRQRELVTIHLLPHPIDLCKVNL